MQHVECHFVERINHIELPSREAHAVQLLERQDVLRLDRAGAVGGHGAPHAAKGIPQRPAGPRPFDFQARILNALVLGCALQRSAERGAVALAGGQLVLSPGASR